MTGHARFIADGLVIAEDVERLPDVDTVFCTLAEATIGRVVKLHAVRVASLLRLDVTPEMAGG